MPNLGAASIGGYMDFVKEMLGLREQRLQEERYKQLERMENQKQMMSTIGDIQEGILGAGKEYQQNQLGNQLSQEYFGGGAGGEANYGNVPQDASFAGAKSAAGGGTPFGMTSSPRQFTGGMQEFKLRMGMAENLSQADYRAAMIKRMGQDYEIKKDEFNVKQAADSKKLISKELDQDTKNQNWLIKENRVVDSAIEKAQTPEQWQTAVDHKIAVNKAAIKRGMDVEPFDPSTIAPFMSQTDKDTLADRQTAVSEARTALEEAQKAPPGLLDRTRSFLGLGTGPGALGYPGIPTQKEGAVKSATELYEQEQQKLRETPGASFYGEKPVTGTTKKSGDLKEAGGPAVGDTKPLRNQKTKQIEIFTWDGTAWVK